VTPESENCVILMERSDRRILVLLMESFLWIKILRGAQDDGEK